MDGEEIARCGATGRRVMRFPGHGGDYERLVHLVCTEEEHADENHYDATYGLEFEPGHQAAEHKPA